MKVTKNHSVAPCGGVLLRERDILELLKVSRATFRRWLNRGEFPHGFQLSERICVWRSESVQAWIDQREQQRTGSL